jgi:hypothetical protein
MIIDITKIPVLLITIESAKERHDKLNVIFNSIGFNNVEYINGKILDKTNLSFMEIQKKKSALVADAHIEALTKVKPPFLILEDDINITGFFKPQIEVPDDADCLYIGSSVWGMVNGVSTGYGTTGTKVNDVVCRTHNMLGIHSIVYITKDYIDATISNLKNCNDKEKFCDECIAEEMINYKTYCVNYPYFYQNDGHNDLVTTTPLGVFFR